MWWQVFGKGDRIGRRLMMLIVAFSSLITLFLTAGQLLLDYHQQRGDMNQMLDDVAVQIPTLSNVVWSFNETQIDLSLDALIRLPNIERAAIVTADGQGRWSKGARRHSTHVVIRQYSLHRMQREGEREIATLEVVASLDAIYRRVFEHALSILLSNALKTFLVAAFMLAIFNRYVTRRVVALAHEVGNLAPRLLMVPVASQEPLARLPAKLDELDAVRWSFDAMAKQLESALVALKGHTDHLEDTVRERTIDLEREKKNLTQALGELQRILDHASLGISLVMPSSGSSRVFVRVNKALENILGYGPGELDGMDTRVAFENDADYARITASYEHTILSGQTYRGEVTCRCKNGQSVLVESVGTAVESGDLSRGTIWLMNDITERRSAECALAEAKEGAENSLIELTRAHAELNDTLEKLRFTQAELVEREKAAALGSLVAGVAHELNTPIGNSLTGASTLRDHTLLLIKQFKDGLKRSSLEAYLDVAGDASEIVVRNLHRAAELINGFKQVAVDQTSAQRRRFRLDVVVSEFIAMLQPSIKKSAYEVEYVIPEGIEMDSFPGPLGQVVSNLINNAFLHGFEGRAEGLVRIEGYLLGEGWVEMMVSDNGVGISKENLGHIFDPFFTTKLGSGGSGLGLNIVHNLVTKILGGRITVQSDPNRGTTFVFSLPLVAPGEAK